MDIALNVLFAATFAKLPKKFQTNPKRLCVEEEEKMHRDGVWNSLKIKKNFQSYKTHFETVRFQTEAKTGQHGVELTRVPKKSGKAIAFAKKVRKWRL